MCRRCDICLFAEIASATSLAPQVYEHCQQYTEFSEGNRDMFILVVIAFVCIKCLISQHGDERIKDEIEVQGLLNTEFDIQFAIIQNSLY